MSKATKSNPIILYDITTKDGGHFSASTIKARLVLGYKGLPFKTEYISYPDIASRCQELRIPPTSQSAPYYTLPAIADPTEIDGEYTYVSDSFKIAQYLEKTYPDTKPIFPHGTLPLQHVFASHVQTHLRGSFFPFILPRIPPILDERSVDYLVRTRLGGKPPSELVQDESKGWAAVHDAWTQFAELLDMNRNAGEEDSEGGPFVMGKYVSYADLLVVGLLHFVRRLDGGKVGEVTGGPKFQTMMEWHDGRWKKLWDELGKYTN